MAPVATIRGGRTVAHALLVVAVLALALAPRGASAALAPRGASAALATRSPGAALSCSTVYNTLMPCLGYVQSGGVVPQACCGGIKQLVSTQRSTPDRRTICTCLKNVGAGAAGGPYISRAAGLPGRCKVPVPYKTGPNGNCNSIN